jgi:hypothetical protein
MPQPPARPRLGPVRWDTISLGDARGYEPFAHFCCGHCALDPSAAEVNGQAAKLYCGGPAELGGPQVHSVLRLLDENDALLGFAGMEMQSTDLSGAFIQVYGREKRLKGHLLANGVTSLGDALIRACLDLAAERTPGPQVPDCFAFTHLDNASSHAVLERFDFQIVPWKRVQGPGGAHQRRYDLPSGKQTMHPQNLWHRPKGDPPARLPANVLVGPVQPARPAQRSPQVATPRRRVPKRRSRSR